MPPGHHAVERLIDDLLNARAHVLDAARREGLHHQSPQPGMVRGVLLQHPMPHRAVDRLVEHRGAVAPGHAADIVLAEALVAQDGTRLGVAADKAESQRRAVDRLGRAQAVIERVGIGDDFWQGRIEQQGGRGSLQRLVQGSVLCFARPPCLIGRTRCDRCLYHVSGALGSGSRSLRAPPITRHRGRRQAGWPPRSMHRRCAEWHPHACRRIKAGGAAPATWEGTTMAARAAASPGRRARGGSLTNSTPASPSPRQSTWQRILALPVRVKCRVNS